MNTNDPATNNRPHGEDELRAARLIAHALGQTDPAERAAIEAELAASAEAREAVRADQVLAAQLQEAARQAPPPERSAELREAVERRLQELETAAASTPSSPQRKPWRGRSRWAMVLVAASLLAAVVSTYWVVALRNAPREPNRDVAAVIDKPAEKPTQPPTADKMIADAFLHLKRGNTPPSAKPADTKGDAVKSFICPRRRETAQVTSSPRFSQIGTGTYGGRGPEGMQTAPGRWNYNVLPYLDSDGEQGVTFSGVLGGTPGLSVSGGTLTLNGSGTYSGGTAVVGGSGGSVVEYMGAAGGGSGSYSIDTDITGVRLLIDSTRAELSDASDATRRLMLGVGVNSDAGLAGNIVLNQRKTTLSPEKKARKDKPVETWKPSRLVPNTSRLMVGDSEELPLRAMQADVRIDGFRARVVLDLYYLNDHPKQLEGNFQLRLPEEAAPYFFAFGRTVYQAAQPKPADAMFFKREQVLGAEAAPEQILALRRGSWEEPKVARMVPREKAAVAYRETVRQRVDPALVQWAGAGVFQCRVFPLAPHSLHRVVIGYDVDLVRAGHDLELRLDLPEKTPACVVDFNIAARSENQVSLDAPAVKSADGQRLSYRLVDPRDRPLVVRLREPDSTMLVGGDGKTGNYFAVRMAAQTPDDKTGSLAAPLPKGLSQYRFVGQPPSAVMGDSAKPGAAVPRSGIGSKPDGSKEAIFLVDTSLSAKPQFSLWTKLLRAVLENNRDRIQWFAVVFFDVETHWWQEKFVDNTPKNVEALMAYADGLSLDGATDLGRALGEAARPSWRKHSQGADRPPELYLLSDGAGTWGEDRWEFMAAALKTPKSGPLFAYHTGLSGSDPRMLAHLAHETGGALFTVVGEAEIARASTAQRHRPWRLASVEMSGGRDLLLAGRPQYVFPGQELLLVGRCEPGLKAGEVVLTLKQGETTRTVRTKIDRVLASELAARTYGQVAVGQLEDAAAAAEAIEPVATGYARHFRIAGRTCSLLMLESEADYARFHIKPEEDDFLVSQRPAAAIVAHAAADNAAARTDPKASFLAWFRGLERNSGVRFELPASLAVALEGMPREAFVVAVPPLRCKLHARKELPQNLQKLWAAGTPQYDDLAAESERRLARYGADDALRVLSSLVEENPGDAAVARDVAFSAIAWDRPGEAYHLLRRAAAGRTFEPLSFHLLARCLEQMGRTDLAVVYYELACGGQWDARFGDQHNIAQVDYFRFLRRLAQSPRDGSLGAYARARLATLTKVEVRDTADLVALIFWNTDGTDVDLHVTEPGGEECFYSHRETASGGRLSQDVTAGYGPEMYILPRAPQGTYHLRAHYFASDANRTSTRTKALAFISRNWGTNAEKPICKALTLVGRDEKHDLAEIVIGPKDPGRE